MTPSIHIGIVDDNTFLISAVKEKLSLFNNIKMAFKAFSGKQAIELLANNRQIDLILMDIEMPDMDGIEATAVIKNNYPQIKVLMLTVFDNDETIFKAIQAGADGYLLKDTKAEDLYDSIIHTLEGGAAMTPSIAMKTLKLLRNPIVIETIGAEHECEISLSKREVEILEQIAKGLSSKAIAENLCIATSTVRKHIENIYKKLQVHSKIEAVEEAKKRRLI